MVELKEFKVTQRDGQILRLLLEGCSNKEIAGELKISPRTVKQHLRSLFQRAGIEGGRKRVKLGTDLRRTQKQAHTVGLVWPFAALSALIEHDSEHNFSPRRNLAGKQRCAVMRALPHVSAMEQGTGSNKFSCKGGTSGADLAGSGSAQKNQRLSGRRSGNR